MKWTLANALCTCQQVRVSFSIVLNVSMYKNQTQGVETATHDENEKVSELFTPLERHSNVYPHFAKAVLGKKIQCTDYVSRIDLKKERRRKCKDKKLGPFKILFRDLLICFLSFFLFINLTRKTLCNHYSLGNFIAMLSLSGGMVGFRKSIAKYRFSMKWAVYRQTFLRWTIHSAETKRFSQFNCSKLKRKKTNKLHEYSRYYTIL